ncbi:MAG TPA: DUF4331 family protein [Candidatus Nitrosotenuis sp.]|jgi:hypothetical protein|nr:DUF4331 family protein [Candidatus Nitrosotenuis sp.]
MNRNFTSSSRPLILALTLALATFLLSGCTSGDDNFASGGGAQPTASPTFSQVEQLARPAINEGLFITNTFLNAYNTLAPSQQLAAIQSTPALATEAVTYLVALATFGADPNPAQRATDEVGAFIPDILRIDTSVRSPNNGVNGATVYNQAYANPAALVPVGDQTGRTIPVVMPAAGRKPEDDVIDVTYSVLTNGATGALNTTNTRQGVVYVPNFLPGDGVDFASSATGADGGAVDNGGNQNNSQGHKFLRGQTAPYGGCSDAAPSSTGGQAFPYLADPY